MTLIITCLRICISDVLMVPGITMETLSGVKVMTVSEAVILTGSRKSMSAESRQTMLQKPKVQINKIIAYETNSPLNRTFLVGEKLDTSPTWGR